MWTTVEVGSTPRCFQLDVNRTDKTQKLLKHSMVTNIRELRSLEIALKSLIQKEMESLPTNRIAGSWRINGHNLPGRRDGNIKILA